MKNKIKTMIKKKIQTATIKRRRPLSNSESRSYKNQLHKSKQLARSSESIDVNSSTNEQFSGDEVDKPEYENQKVIGNIRPEQLLRHKTPAPIERRPVVVKHSTNSTLIWIIVILFLFIILIFRSEKSQTSFLEKVNCSDLLELKTKFPNLDKKIFKALKSGIEVTFNGKPPEPSVFSLYSTDKELIANVMNEVVKVTMKCINQENDPLVIKKEQITEKLVTKYKDELTKRNLMIINNIDEASGSDISSLHSFCDTYNPLVVKSVIFFTMTIKEAPEGKPIDYVTNYLNNLWISLSDNIRGPLITRILDQAFYLQP